MDKNFHPLSQDAQVQTLLGANLFINNNPKVIINFHSKTTKTKTKFTDVNDDDETYATA
jgi:hypothetical protein